MPEAKWYGHGILAMHDNKIDWGKDSIRVALLKNSYTPDRGSHQYWSEIQDHEIRGAGYVFHGKELVNKSKEYDPVNVVLKYKANPVVWESAYFEARYAIIYQSSLKSKHSLLIGYLDFGEDQAVYLSNFTINWDSQTVLSVT